MTEYLLSWKHRPCLPIHFQVTQQEADGCSWSPAAVRPVTSPLTFAWWCHPVSDLYERATLLVWTLKDGPSQEVEVADLSILTHLLPSLMPGVFQCWITCSPLKLRIHWSITITSIITCSPLKLRIHWSIIITSRGQPQHSSVQSLCCVRLFATPGTAAHQASLSITNSQSCAKTQP